MRRIAPAVLAVLAVAVAIGPASASAVSPFVTPAPGHYEGKGGRFMVEFRLTQKEDVIDFTDGTRFTSAKPTPVASLRREDPKEVANPRVFFQECAGFCIQGFWVTPTKVIGKYWPPGRPDDNLDFEVELEKAPSK